MDDTQAKQLVQETFSNDLDVERLIHFTRELLDGLQVEKKKCAVWKEYEDYLDHYELVGTYIDQARKELDVIIVKLKRTRSRDLARTMQRNLIAKYLKTAGRDAALVAFYGDDPTDWRFSFVKLEYQLRKEGKKVKPVEELTPVKRYSFLVGKNEPNHTCQKQFLELLKREDTKPTLEELENAFSIDKVTKEFFDEYKERYLELKETLDRILEKDVKTRREFEEKNIDTMDFAKKLLGQIVFLYFLQKKGWLGLGKDPETKKFYEWGKGPKDFIRKLFDKKIVPYDNFFNDILEPLFYEALAKQRDEDYYSKFKCKIPFLDGGLFEAINDYDWTDARIPLPNKEFERVLDTFDRFNFTVKEDEPLDKEVAVDPEMLGKVFENLLEVKDRKSKGAFYTPREIVHYMCQQSLINYLETNTELSREDIEAFIQDGNLEEIPHTIVKDYLRIDNLLKDIKVVDPAVGSGAFPVGMMSEIVKARTQLTRFFGKETQTCRTNYILKRETVENCLYGVDIDSSAIEIAKLRFWLSLVVDEDDMDNVKPLPNLDHKLMVGNSLLEEFNGVKLFDDKLLGIKPGVKNPEIERLEKEIQDLSFLYGEIAVGKQKGDMRKVEAQIAGLKRKIQKLKSQPQNFTQFTLDETPKIKESQRKLSELKKLQKQFFNAQGKKEKTQCKNQIEKLEWELIEETLKEQGSESAIKELEQFKKNKSKPFFLWKLYFFDVFQRDNPGFDVVIANPPYIRVQELKHEDVDTFKKKYAFAHKRIDISLLFFELGLGVLRQNGALTFISSNQFLVTEYGEKAREGLLPFIRTIINFESLPIFENALTYVSIFTLITNESRRLNYVKINSIEDFEESLDFTAIDKSNLGSEYWTLDKKEYLDLIKKIRAKTRPLSEFADSYYGVISGKDDVFILEEQTINQMKIERNYLRKIIFPEDIKKWKLNEPKYSLIYTYTSNGKRTELESEANLNKETPNLFKFLISNKQTLEARKDSRTDFKGRVDWYGLVRFSSIAIFNQIKIISPTIVKKNKFALDSEGYSFAGGKTVAIIGNKIENKCLLAILNSKLAEYYYQKNTPAKAGGYRNYSATFILNLPIKVITEKLEMQFIELVNKIQGIATERGLAEPTKQEKIRNLENEIDILIYKLYELTPEEIVIIENAAQMKDSN